MQGMPFWNRLPEGTIATSSGESMSIIFELFKSTGKKVCPPFHVRKGNCPLIVRTTSEDLLTANVFGILKNLDPKIWLRRLLGEAIKGQDFSQHSFEDLSFEFWKKYRPPINRATREGVSEVDVTLSYKDGVIFIEAKYLAPISQKTTHDADRNQIIRYLDLAAYHFLNYPGSAIDFYLILITDTEEPPMVLTHYLLPKKLIEGISSGGLFGIRHHLFDLLAEGTGWISWDNLNKILKNTRDQFQTQVEKHFLDDLILYLTYKLREAERIRNERKQLSLF
jgi:hypothetical protein